MDTADALGYVEDPARKVPVLYDVDVVVAGAGTAAIIAAIAAGRYGAKTLLIDRFGQVGGNIGPGMWCGGSLHLALVNQADPDDEELVNRKGMGGIPEEFHRRVVFGRPNADEIPDEVRRKLEEKHLNVAGYRPAPAEGCPGTSWTAMSARTWPWRCWRRPEWNFCCPRTRLIRSWKAAR